MKTALKNMIRGVLVTVGYVISLIIVPYQMFSFLQTIDLSQLGNITLNYTAELIQQIQYTILAYGMMCCACAFLMFSSPSKSIRRAIFSVVLLFFNCLYIWSFVYSGASEIVANIPGFATISLSFIGMVFLTLGAQFLKVIIKIYDLIDFTINRKSIQEKRGLK